jgi:hypothetical protein
VDLVDLMAYKAWANSRLFAALQRMDEAALRAAADRVRQPAQHPA